MLRYIFILIIHGLPSVSNVYLFTVSSTNTICVLNHQLTVGCDFFENTLAMSKMLVQRNLGVLRQRVNKDL